MTHRRTLALTALLTLAGCGDSGATHNGNDWEGKGVALGIHVAQSGAGDALWDLSVVNESEPPETLWAARTPSSQYGDMQGSVSYVGPCDAGAGAEGQTNHASVSLVGLYAAPVAVADVGEPGDPAPSGALEFWPLPPITRDFPCLDGQDVAVNLKATLATVDRGGDAVTARFGGVGCEASWTCADDGPGGELTLSCAADGDTAPTLLYDEPVLHCLDADQVALTAADGSGVSAEAGDGEARVTWRFVADLDASALSGTCFVAGRATAVPPNPQPYFGVPGDGAIRAGDVYPVIGWAIPVSDGAGPSCDAATLDVGGPIDITYSDARAESPLTFAHDSAETSAATE